LTKANNVKRLVAILVLALAAVALGQTNDPTDTPTVRALTALIPLKEQALRGQSLAAQERQALFAKWLALQGHQAAFAEWLAGQVELGGKAKFAMFLATPEDLLATRALYERPNYGGNAFAPLQRTLWLRMARGESVAE
jgi:hypothetical protein